MNDLVLAVTDVNLAVNFARRAIVVSVHSDGPIFSTVESIKNLVSIDGSATKVDLIVPNQVNGG